MSPTNPPSTRRERRPAWHRGRHPKLERDLDPDAIWRGEIRDADIVMTAAEHAALDHEQREAARRRTLVELFGDPVGSLVVDEPGLQHRRRGDGARSSAAIEQARTAGCREEIQVAVLAHPVVAAESLDDLMLFRSVTAVEVDETSRASSRKQITWDATVRTTPWTRRRARLRLYGSPSSNVTVLTLTPVRSRRRGARRFLRAGLGSLFEWRDRIEQSLASG
jgi:hypothetical protein